MVLVVVIAPSASPAVAVINLKVEPVPFSAVLHDYTAVPTNSGSNSCNNQNPWYWPDGLCHTPDTLHMQAIPRSAGSVITQDPEEGSNPSWAGVISRDLILSRIKLYADILPDFKD